MGKPNPYHGVRRAAGREIQLLIGKDLDPLFFEGQH